MSLQPIRNMLSRWQLMNYSFNPLHIVNTYGAFGSITRTRREIVIEGTSDPTVTHRTEWRAYDSNASQPWRPLVSPLWCERHGRHAWGQHPERPLAPKSDRPREGH